MKARSFLHQRSFLPMLFLFLSLIDSLKPVILLPPLYGTNLHVTYNQTDLPWYCPKQMNDELLWVDPKLLVPPRYNCVFQLLLGFYDNETDKIVNRPGVNISVHDFGGEESNQYVDSGIFGFQFIDAFASMLKYFKDHGYVVGKNLFVAPYDWRFAPAAIYDFWPQLQNLIELAHSSNNMKVTLMGYSCGGFNLHHFLTKRITEDWKQEHIEKIVFLTPSFGGTHDVFDSLFNRYSPLLPYLRNADIANMCEGLPCLHSHLLNHEVYGDIPLVRGPDGETYTARELPDLLIKHNRIKGQYINMLKHSVEYQKEAPADINLPTTIVYNTGMPTHILFDFKRGWDKSPTVEQGRGDGTIPSNAAEWACDHWDHKNTPKICIDLDNHEKRFKHQPLTYNPFIHELIFNLTSRSDWLNFTGRTDYHLPYIKILKNNTYQIREDIRPFAEKHID
ncbi:Lecithin:cholesterol acyltransferase family protein [Tritrichomonas foetus]|uniref:Lecithin:cholesterol acyltransferase family protein n=1 Tax=Tritrichomonas foetus TaxID=1144522 RepID=A0A1J4K0Q1_9EUKA|nr:Lecithin:cholesterol acyltransferase family protein [Tritrichomonas foetus]|eukprot:OHT04951.1 Lecithin:cholesterol acyltransferase family protein [Tritrichomonas foetus]